MPSNPKPTRRLSQKTLAQSLGLSQSTVCLALANDARLPPETRDRVQREARKLGYVPDPMLGALAAYRKSHRPLPLQETIAWITNHPKRDEWKTASSRRFFQGAEERAKELGYRLEPFWLREFHQDWKRASQTLLARGIRGLLIAPQPKSRMRVRLEWDQFASIALGYTVAWPALPIAATHHFRSMTLLLRELRSLGYRRIGLALDALWDERVDRGWSGGYLSHHAQWPARHQVKPHLPRLVQRKPFLDWLNTEKPEAVISLDDAPLLWMQETGYQIPKEIGFATLVANDNAPQVSGVNQNEMETGRTAINHLARRLQHREWGIPSLPPRILTESTWIPGKTVRRVTMI